MAGNCGNRYKTQRTQVNNLQKVFFIFKDIIDFSTQKYCHVKFLFKFLIEILDKWDFLKINDNIE